MAPSVPAYPVIVIPPLLVVKVNWACTAAGHANKNSAGSNPAAPVRNRHLLEIIFTADQVWQRR
jgi:hypothetical protein